MELIKQPLDYLGVNFYFPRVTVPDPGSELGFKTLPFSDAREPLTGMGWEVYAPALRCELHNYHRRYKLPIYITENGLSVKADGAGPGPDGKLQPVTIKTATLEK